MRQDEEETVAHVLVPFFDIRQSSVCSTCSPQLWVWLHLGAAAHGAEEKRVVALIIVIRKYSQKEPQRQMTSEKVPTTNGHKKVQRQISTKRAPTTDDHKKGLATNHTKKV